MARLPRGVKRVVFPSGAVRYEVRIDTTDAAGKTRRGARRRFTTPKAAAEALAAAAADARAGRLVAREGLTVSQAVSQWLAGQRLAPTTRAAYEAALAPLTEFYGDRRVQTITRADAEALIAALRVGGGPGGRHWGRSTINALLARWRAIWADLIDQGILGRDVLAGVKPLRKRDDPDAYDGVLDLSKRLTDDEVAALVSAHPPVAEVAPPPRRDTPAGRAALRAPLVHLALAGLRRGELAGLRWSDVDLDAGTIAVAAQTRIAVGGKEIHGTGKTMSARRRLMLPTPLLDVLRLVRERQQRAREIYGDAWSDDGYVIALANGRAASIATLNSWWRESLSAAGVAHRRLHDARHTAASRLISMGASPATTAAWLGHSDGGALALRTYAHTDADDLSAAAALLDYSKPRPDPGVVTGAITAEALGRLVWDSPAPDDVAAALDAL